MGKGVIIVDDLVQSGGTLYEAGMAVKQAGASSVSCFVAHGMSNCKNLFSMFSLNLFSKCFLQLFSPSIHGADS